MSWTSSSVAGCGYGAIGLHFINDNFLRQHQSIGTAPAEQAGLVTKPWTMMQFMELPEQEEQRTYHRLQTRSIEKGGQSII